MQKTHAQWYEWSEVTSPTASLITAVETSVENRIYLSGISISGVYMSEDFGLTWGFNETDVGLNEMQYIKTGVLGDHLVLNNTGGYAITWDGWEGNISTSFYPFGIYTTACWLSNVKYYTARTTREIYRHFPDDPLAGTIIPSVPAITSMIKKIFFFKEIGWLVTDDGEIYNYDERKSPNWELNYESVDELNDIYFTSAYSGYCIGNRGFLMKTTNGGRSWKLQDAGTEENLYSIKFRRNGQGIIGGGAGSIFTTINGSNWVEETLPISFSVYDVDFINDTLAIAVGSGGKIIIGNRLGLDDNHKIYDKRGNNWLFGEHSGIEFFENDSIGLFPFTELEAFSGASSLSDTSGELRYYTDGNRAWDIMNEVVIESEGLPGGTGCASNFKTLMADHPDINERVFIFHQGMATPHSWLDSIKGTFYSIIHDYLHDGIPGMTALNDTLNERLPLVDITAVNHANQRDFWVLMHEKDQFNFYAYLVDCNGLLRDPVISAFNEEVSAKKHVTGRLKASPRGDKIIMAWREKNDSHLQLFDFNPATGKVSNKVEIDNDNMHTDPSPGNYFDYEPAFSGNGSKLYVEIEDIFSSHMLVVYDLDLADDNSIAASKDTVLYFPFAVDLKTGQLGPDGRIYYQGNGEGLSIIQNPNQESYAVEFIHNATIPLDGISYRDLPRFNQSIFYTPEILNSPINCFEKTVDFELARPNYPVDIDSLRWSFGDPKSNSNNTSVLMEPSHSFSGTGYYWVTAVRYYNNGYPDTARIRVYLPDLVSDLPDEMYLDSSLVLDLSQLQAGRILWEDGSTSPLKIVDEPGIYRFSIDYCGCGIVSDSIKVVRRPKINYLDITFPNVFSPNSDDTNEEFKLTFHTPFPFDWEVKIVNRWGVDVGYMNNENDTWDGIALNGALCNTGVYYYQFKAEINGDYYIEHKALHIIR
ncbi:T9SS type B sorting domain-containing protein [Crocinitomix catalasitica]|uniref:T9SS type B sorting domain-containing protein n=1 Tax=Crocinitomix catalasitica TaxID=184607 RepID=UPI000486C5E7|nr:gliding motility-associated C-terminal domain-containing protein [Crocinitomix catalasitica]